ncbi:MAG: hypothetical protein E4G97_03205 [Deltaproteobacteria bacterium]|nr:MAG: hypothetical protein E4G97_03205 [Deltaproteobacteria bacterium]
MNRFVAGICVVLVTGLLGAVAPAEAVDLITAKSGLEKAVAEAKKWKPDAVLAGVGTLNAKVDGTSFFWNYDFQSHKTNTCARVIILATGKATTQDYGNCTFSSKPIATTFVDSPAAVTAAKAGGFQAGEEINLSLTHRRDRNLTPSRECWSLSSPEHDFDKKNAVMRSWCVDPKSGKFVTRLAGEGGK